jgi:hypothetical protein
MPLPPLQPHLRGGAEALIPFRCSFKERSDPAIRALFVTSASRIIYATRVFVVRSRSFSATQLLF